MMFQRTLEPFVERHLRTTPCVCLLGSRQVGKTTLARSIASRHENTLFFDMERESDRAALANPELFLPAHRDRLIVLDEVQRVPQIFEALRPEIDADRRAGRFLLLGSASGALLRQSGESLAGRIAYLELAPLLASEVKPDAVGLQSLWLRGGYPLSHLAPDDEASYAWRLDFVRTFLERDLPEMGSRVAAESMRRFWQMLGHLQGQMFNASQLAQSLGGASHTTATRYLDTLVDAMMVRRLPPHLPNAGKRLVKSPKVYLRDSGLLHALLAIPDVRTLQGHPIAGASWEGFVMEQLAAHLPADARLSYYRTAAGAELDAVVEQGPRVSAIEIKFSAAPKPSRGFWTAFEDVRADRGYVIAPVARRYRLADQVDVVPVEAIPSLFNNPVSA